VELVVDEAAPVALGMLAETEIEEDGEIDATETTEVVTGETIDETDDPVGMAAKTPPAWVVDEGEDVVAG